MGRRLQSPNVNMAGPINFCATIIILIYVIIKLVLA
jgi:hypothetical protein